MKAFTYHHSSIYIFCLLFWVTMLKNFHFESYIINFSEFFIWILLLWMLLFVVLYFIFVLIIINVVPLFLILIRIIIFLSILLVLTSCSHSNFCSYYWWWMFIPQRDGFPSSVVWDCHGLQQRGCWWGKVKESEKEKSCNWRWEKETISLKERKELVYGNRFFEKIIIWQRSTLFVKWTERDEAKKKMKKK